LSIASWVRANPKKAQVKPKARVVIRVVALPAQAGQRVVVQEQRGAAWFRVGKGVTNARGVGRVSFSAPKVRGDHTYRATAAASGQLSPGASQPFFVKVK